MPHKDPAARAAYRKKYREAHRKEAAEKTRLWREANPGRNAENAKRWREENPEKAAASEKKWKSENRERINERQREWRKRTNYASSPKRIAQSLKDWLKTYGLTPEEYEKMLENQGGVCAICQSPHPRMKNAKRLYVDHCHETGTVRGLLCHQCNAMLGHSGDSPETLRKAAIYLETVNDDCCGTLCRY